MSKPIQTTVLSGVLVAMARGIQDLAHGAIVRAIASLAFLAIVEVPVAMGADAIKTCHLQAPGDGCVFDLSGSARAFLTADTRATVRGNLWRTTFSEAKYPGAISNVGTGSTTRFSGRVIGRVDLHGTYEVVVTLEPPLSQPFVPTSVEVRFSGPVAVADPRPISASIQTGFSAPVPQTGQINSIRAFDDGYIQAGVKPPSPRFKDNNDGTVVDSLTGLMWLKDHQCYFAWNGWADAVDFAQNLSTGQCGLNDDSHSGDWRLPNIKELLSLIDYGRYGPALPEGHPFGSFVASSYWTSTTRSAEAGESGEAWAVYPYNASVISFPTNLSGGVWPVRSSIANTP